MDRAEHTPCVTAPVTGASPPGPSPDLKRPDNPGSAFPSSLPSLASYPIARRFTMHRSQTAPVAEPFQEPLHASKSFSRLEPTPRPLSQHRSRASTIDGIAYPKHTALSPDSEALAEKSDIFAGRNDGDGQEDGPADAEAPSMQLQETFEQLPIELRSLTERFLESLSAKVHPSPLSIDALTELFQEFYMRANNLIGTHIGTLSSRLARDSSPAPSVSSRHSSSSRAVGKVGSAASLRSGAQGDGLAGGEQQMLTASEIHNRKKARRSLEYKRYALEEAVERVVCEKIYDRVFRHRGTDDAERDEKLRSRAAALAVVGIGLKDLVGNADDVPQHVRDTTVERESEIREWLSGARDSLQAMNEERYPLGKLRHLTTAHKSIVETLSRVFPASSSADEILPTVIYTLISLPPEGTNVISNLTFIQRFRASDKMDGEAAYCLVNLEAAISFLETVDLSSLRADAVPKISEKSTPVGTPPLKPTGSQLAVASSNSLSRPLPSPLSLDSSSKSGSPQPSPTVKHSRRLSNLIHTQTTRLEAAGDAVRDAVLDGADQAFDSINTTLESSFRFLFGRLREEQQNRQQHKPSIGGDEGPGNADSDATAAPQLKRVATEDVVMPKTLEDARKLVSTPPPEDDAGSVSAASSVHEPEEDGAASGSKRENRLVELVGGRRPMRDRSVDSARSATSGGGGGGGSKRVSFIGSKPDAASIVPPTATATGGSPGAMERTVSSGSGSNQPLPTSPPPSAVESMRNLGNSLNPLNRFSPINMLPRFGRPGPSQGPAAAAPAPTSSPGPADAHAHAPEPKAAPAPEMKTTAADARMLEAALLRESGAVAALEELKRTAPPVKRFLEVKDPGQLRIDEVGELLKEYQRLAGALRGAITS